MKALLAFWVTTNWFSRFCSQNGYLNSKLMLRWDGHLTALSIAVFRRLFSAHCSVSANMHWLDLRNCSTASLTRFSRYTRLSCCSSNTLSDVEEADLSLGSRRVSPLPLRHRHLRHHRLHRGGCGCPLAVLSACRMANSVRPCQAHGNPPKSASLLYEATASPLPSRLSLKFRRTLHYLLSWIVIAQNVKMITKNVGQPCWHCKESIWRHPTDSHWEEELSEKSRGRWQNSTVLYACRYCLLMMT